MSRKFIAISCFALSLSIMVSPAFFSSGEASAFGTWSWPTKTGSQYKVSAKGADFRVYEWESDKVPGKFCVAAFSDAGPVGLDCDPSAPRAKTSQGTKPDDEW